MAKAIDLTGMKFGRLTVIERAGSTKAGQARWRCKCECGNNTTVEASHLKRGNVQSCGCLFKEFHNKHGMYGTKFYKVWDGIKNRCFNSNRQDYERYGGRGITLAAEWVHDFQAFYDYVSKLEHFNEQGYTLD